MITSPQVDSHGKLIRMYRTAWSHTQSEARTRVIMIKRDATTRRTFLPLTEITSPTTSLKTFPSYYNFLDGIISCVSYVKKTGNISVLQML